MAQSSFALETGANIFSGTKAVQLWCCTWSQKGLEVHGFAFVWKSSVYLHHCWHTIAFTLLQLRLSPVVTEHSIDPDVSKVNRSNMSIKWEDTLEVVVANHLKESAISGLQMHAIHMLVTTVVRSSFMNYRRAVTTLAESRKKFTIKKPEESRAMDGFMRPGDTNNLLNTTSQKGSSRQRGSGRRWLESNDCLIKGLTGVAAQNQWMIWLLAYVVVVTTWPLIGSALFFRAHRRITAFTKKALAKIGPMAQQELICLKAQKQHRP